MKYYFELSGLRNCTVKCYFSHNVITDNRLDCEKLQVDGFDCAIRIDEGCTGLSVFQSVTVLTPYLWIKTSDINFDLSNVRCNREIDITYEYTWYQWVARFVILACRKFTKLNKTKDK